MGNSSLPMIFVTGASRSGTTLTAQILGKHSRIAGLAELHYFGEFCDPRREPADRRIVPDEAVETLFTRQNEGILAPRRRRSGDPEARRVLDRLGPEAAVADVFAETAVSLARRVGKAVPCEQTPRNIYYAPALLSWYPQARVVHMLRDPRGVLASQKFRWRRRSLMADPSKMTYRQQLRTWVNYHPYTVAQLWNLATRQALALSDHPRVHLLKLEDLILEPERRLRELCAFLGVEFEPAMLDIDRVNSSHVPTASGGKGLSRESIDGWRGRLSADELAVVFRRSGALMERVGYRPEPVAGTRVGRLATGARYLTHLAGAVLINPRRSVIQARALLRGVIRSRPGSHGGRRRTGSTEARLVPLFGLPFTDESLEGAARHLVAWAAARVKRRVVFVNAHSLNVSVRDQSLRQALDDADVVYADGVGMALAARLQGERLGHNVNGTDLFPHLCREAAARGVPIALLGAAPGVVEDCAARLRRAHPALKIAFVHHGYLGPGDTRSVVEQVNRSGAGILLVAMGVPRQERWIAAHAHELTVPVVIGVGGLFDFVSGRVPRAPVAVRRLRLEWLFRLLVEPRRLFGRYVIGNPAFLARALRYALTGRLTPGSRETATR